MVMHFFSDITHFDGKFFVSLKWLIRKPGFLSAEYIAGRRARYLHPIRMYVFTSAVFFIIFFSVFSAESFDVTGLNDGQLSRGVRRVSEQAYKNAKTKEDSLDIQKTLALVKMDQVKDEDTGRVLKPRAGFSYGNAASKYNTISAYDSAQEAMPPGERDGWFFRLLNKKAITVKQKYGDDNRQLWKDLLEKFVHSFPYMLFVSLPLYALWLKLLYFRRKKFFYAEHGVFLIHLYIFTFLLLLLYFAFDKLEDYVNSGIWNLLKTILILGGIYYAFRAMKNFYGQGFGKTLLKFILFNLVCLISLLVLFAIFFVFSFYRV